MRAPMPEPPEADTATSLGPADTGFDTRVGCYAVVVDGARVLLPHWHEGGQSGWTLPGGGLEWGESPEQTCVREVAEETGYHVALDGLLGVDNRFVAAEERHHTRRRGPRGLHALRLVYAAHVIGGALATERDGTTDDVRWFDLREVPDLPRVTVVDVGLGFLLDRLRTRTDCSPGPARP